MHEDPLAAKTVLKRTFEPWLVLTSGNINESSTLRG
jgi:hypothetical protein